ncbi:MAG: (2Fe-2S)-binding protein [candidate division Zixibacteria bacterium]|nr:(2Fe-2S)-binding protein [Candidatus Tariuqbacter arcticus]
MPKIKINGAEHEFDKGTNLIDACRQAGVEIPHFCYHPVLSIAGSCRMCQVEVQMNGRKSLTIACNTTVADGMEITTESELVAQVQNAVIEFLLLNHPLDCPICDEAGECKLQDYYMEYDRQPSRMDEPKLRKHKVVDLGPNVVLDSERCILCSRCVRFFREIIGKDELEIYNSGAYAEIAPLPNKKLDNDYTGNAVDLCPVGALTDRRFRFKRRAWYLQAVDSICPGCSRGCNIEIHFDLNHNWKRQERRIQRLKPRLNLEVNKYWMCDPGRYGCEYIDAPDRLTKALIRTDNGLIETDYDEARRQMGARLKKAISGAGRSKTAVILAPQLSTGALYILKKLVTAIGVVNVDYRLPTVSEGKLDDLLQMSDRNPNSFAAEMIGLTPGEGGLSLPEILQAIKAGKIQNLLAVCCDPVELLGEADKAALAKLKFFGILHWTKVPAIEFAHFALPIAAFAEGNGTYINFEGRVQRFNQAVEPLGDSRRAWQTILLLGREMGYKFKAFSDAELFEAFANSADEYKGLIWDKIGHLGFMPK